MLTHYRLAILKNRFIAYDILRVEALSNIISAKFQIMVNHWN